MKKYFNYILMTFLGVLISCTPEKWTEEPTVMTDIYRLENLRDGLAIDVYRNLPLMIEEKGNLLTSFATSDFVDNSTNKIYSFSYSVVIKSKADTKSGDEQTILKKYVCDGSRQSGMAKLVVETYINDVLDKEEKFSSLALYELQRPTSAADVPASEIPSDVFCIAVDTFFVDQSNTRNICVRANAPFGLVENSGFTAIINNDTVDIYGVTVSLDNSSILKVRVDRMLTAEDVVTLSYDGKGNIKSSIGKLLEPFEKLPVKFVEEPEDEDDDGEVNPDSRENIFLGDKFTFNSDATIGNLGWSIAPNGAIVKDSQIKFGDKGYSLKITASGTSGNFYLMNLAQHTIDIPSGNYELIFYVYFPSEGYIPTGNFNFDFFKKPDSKNPTTFTFSNEMPRGKWIKQSANIAIESQLSGMQCRFMFNTLVGVGTFYLDQLELRRIGE